MTLSVPHQQRLPLAIAALGFLFLGLFLLYPLFNVFGASVLDGDGEKFTFANYVKILGRPFYRGAVANTLMIGVAATITTIVKLARALGMKASELVAEAEAEAGRRRTGRKASPV